MKGIERLQIGNLQRAVMDTDDTKYYIAADNSDQLNIMIQPNKEGKRDMFLPLNNSKKSKPPRPIARKTQESETKQTLEHHAVRPQSA
jgi:hypothetical protein